MYVWPNSGLPTASRSITLLDSPARINHPNNRAVPPADCQNVSARVFRLWRAAQNRMHYSKVPRTTRVFCISADEERGIYSADMQRCICELHIYPLFYCPFPVFSQALNSILRCASLLYESNRQYCDVYFSFLLFKIKYVYAKYHIDILSIFRETPFIFFSNIFY